MIPATVPAGLVDFSAVGLPEYSKCYATVVDSLFSEAELSAILAEAETASPWVIAQINAGTEVYTIPSFRHGERIIYDSHALSERVFLKFRPYLKDIEEIEEPVYVHGRGVAVQKWRMVRMNERLRFLRYPKGGFFRAHVDGEYEDVCVSFYSFRPCAELTVMQENGP
jgi:hypothetical protein